MQLLPLVKAFAQAKNFPDARTAVIQNAIAQLTADSADITAKVAAGAYPNNQDTKDQQAHIQADIAALRALL